MLRELLDEVSGIPPVRWRVSNSTYVRDILELLVQEQISIAKADEAIHERIAGNIPALPEKEEQKDGFSDSES
jgi:hypothetical protein